MPIRNKRILGSTSLWMIILILNCNLSPFCGLLGASCCASTLFWFNPEQKSLRHRADKSLSSYYSISLLFYTIYRICKYNYPILLFTSLSGSTVIFFNLSDYFFKCKKYNIQLVSHLLFRYSIFWWSFTVFNEIETYYYNFLIISSGYLTHILLFLVMKEWDDYNFYLR